MKIGVGAQSLRPRPSPRYSQDLSGVTDDAGRKDADDSASNCWLWDRDCLDDQWLGGRLEDQSLHGRREICELGHVHMDDLVSISWMMDQFIHAPMKEDRRPFMPVHIATDTRMFALTVSRVARACQTPRFDTRPSIFETMHVFAVHHTWMSGLGIALASSMRPPRRR